MAVRIKIRIVKDGIVKDVVALVNSGFETENPQLLIPVQLAKGLNLWPPVDAKELTYETAGGPLTVWFYPRIAKAKAIAPDAESKEVVVDIAVSALADEVLISDKLAGGLELVVEDFAVGLWRFRWEPRDKLRKSEPPELYK